MLGFQCEDVDSSKWLSKKQVPSSFMITRNTIGFPSFALILFCVAASGAHATADSTAPAVTQDFNQSTPWASNIDSTGIWRIAGPWVGTGSNTLLPSLAATQASYPGDTGTGFLALSINPGPSLQGSEIQTLPTTGYNYGYYETRLKLTPVAGGVVSFFLVEAPNYGPHEIDIEFLMNEPWLTNPNAGQVHYTLHSAGGSPTYVANLGFNPTLGFHTYGILWTAGTIQWYVDGVLSYTLNDADFNTTAQMFIMANTWSGNANWGGGPPSQVSTSYYDWMKFWPNVIAPQDPITFTQWENLFFSASQMKDATVSGPNATPQHDGIPNLLKFLFDIDPAEAMLSSDKAALPQVGTTVIGGTPYITLTYRQKPQASGITVNVQTSTDLQSWKTVTPDFTQTVGTDSITKDPIIEVEVKTTSPAREFIRLNVTSP